MGHSRKLPLKLECLKRALRSRQIPIHPNAKEQELVKAIQRKVNEKNQNNITRTNAYFQFFQAFPEIQWAFLAHMVSRNSGWNMTDLKGSYLSELLTDKQQEYFFNYLERSNWLIFQDAYPQLLLYKEAKKSGRNLFHLLPCFGVSIFMQTIWNTFYSYHDKELLSVALIINEQHYIENRVIHNSNYRANLLELAEIKFQELLQLNMILFPYQDGSRTRLVGQAVNHFAALDKRILLGKRLYEILFDPTYFQKILTMACQHPHTGSREDFFPNLFQSERLGKGFPLYSPKLQSAWEDVQHKPAETGDWYKDWKVLYYFLKDQAHYYPDILDLYIKSLHTLEQAALLKDRWLK